MCHAVIAVGFLIMPLSDGQQLQLPFVNQTFGCTSFLHILQLTFL